MQQRLATVMAGLACLIGFKASAATTRAALLLAADTAKPGDTILAGVRFQLAEGWHIYWRNPGGPGIPTGIEWKLPRGVTAGEIRWPTPEKFVMTLEEDPASEKIINYGYSHEVTLLVPLKLASDLKPGPLELKAMLTWLECKVQCVRGTAEVSARINVGAETTASDSRPLLERLQASLPKPGDALGSRVRWEKTASGDTRPLLIEWNPVVSVADPDFYPDAYETFEVQTETETLSDGGTPIRLRKLVKKTKGDWPKHVSGLLVQRSGGEIQGFEVNLPIGGDASLPSAVSAPSTPAHRTRDSIWIMLLYAFIGGLILNVMPCVLPVIALKILGFINQARESPGRVRKLGLIYGAGVLVSFLALAALVIGVKAAGHQAGWGMQFSNPQFVVALTVLVTLVALNLFGLFDVTLGGRVMGAASGLASQHGAAGAFFNGVLATILATPCTAPFLGAALGFAFAQPAAIIVLMFLTVGAGLAAPYVVLSWQPAWLKFLPKPGAWMEKFKIAMGFPMLAAAVWLFSLTTTFYGDRTWWLGIFLVVIGAAAWIFGAFVQRGGKGRVLALVITLLLMAVGYTWALESKLRWRSPMVESQSSGAGSHAPEGYNWQRWSTEAVAKARAAGRVVIVDFTARWCLTCNITVKPALESKAVIEKLEQLNAVALVADYTRYPPEITEELARFDRTGVPLVLVYPADSGKPPIVLPEPLPYPAPYSPVALSALEKAAR